MKHEIFTLNASRFMLHEHGLLAFREEPMAKKKRHRAPAANRQSSSTSPYYRGADGRLYERPEEGCCLVCGEELRYDRECPNGCTESDDYGFLHGFYFGVGNDDE